MEEEYDPQYPHYPPRCVSYLQARDPSIICWNRPGIQKVRQNLVSQFSSESTITIPSIPSDTQDEGLSVHLRIKGGGGVSEDNIYHVENSTLICTVPEGSQAAKSNRDKSVVVKKKYKFTSIFGPDTSQKELFDTIIKDKILSVINGNNSTMLAYGASGAGKTFTMVGTAEHPGMIPRSLDYLFRTILKSAEHEPNVKPLSNGKIELLSDLRRSQEIEVLRNILQDPQAFSERNHHVKTYKEMQRRLSSNQVGIVNSFPPIVGVWVSFAEIYNENIYDLLEPLPGRNQQRRKLKIGGLQDETYIRGLKYVYVRSGLEAYQVLQYGLHNLSYAATAINQHSSRSHCIFSIRLVAGNDEQNCNVSVFNFCDLAGSERLKKTMNEGDRLKESTKINTSLSVLGRCINNIRDMQQNVKDACTAPFRESKLTQLFQKALQGKEDILMIVNINPSEDMFDDTQHALIFSAIAKQIVTQEVPQKIMKPSRFSSYRQNLSLNLEEDEDQDERENELRELRDERAQLVLELSEYKEQVELLVEAERTHLRTNYDLIIELKDSQLSDLRIEVEELRQTKEQLEKDRRQLHRELLFARKLEEVIVLSSSEEESDDEENEKQCVNGDAVNSRQHYLNEIENLKKAHQKEMEKANAEKEELLRNQKEMSNTIKELEQTLQDANTDFNQLLRECEDLRFEVNDLTSKNVMLEDQLSVQNDELECLRHRTVAQTEEIDRLEDQNSELMRQTRKEEESQGDGLGLSALAKFEDIEERLEDQKCDLIALTRHEDELECSS